MPSIVFLKESCLFHNCFLKSACCMFKYKNVFLIYDISKLVVLLVVLVTSKGHTKCTSGGCHLHPALSEKTLGRSDRCQ